jgi:hypothetical protein
METIMLVVTLPARLAFWLGRPVRLDVIPAVPEQQAAEPVADPATARPVLTPSADLETRLILRDRGWNPYV